MSGEHIYVRSDPHGRRVVEVMQGNVAVWETKWSRDACDRAVARVRLLLGNKHASVLIVNPDGTITVDESHQSKQTKVKE